MEVILTGIARIMQPPCMVVVHCPRIMKQGGRDYIGVVAVNIFSIPVKLPGRHLTGA